jgi:hypothetical protein
MVGVLSPLLVRVLLLSVLYHRDGSLFFYFSLFLKKNCVMCVLDVLDIGLVQRLGEIGILAILIYFLHRKICVRIN